mmetsp:Transcript_12524/g.23555  ORF Transcript_12524/g.23555 Transcript_12524/m.23555 type:complete len:99 (-) Transcript_12524:1313-1609(-)
MSFSFSNRQVAFVGSVCFLALTYRNLDLKYTLNEKIEQLETSLERERRENKILERELAALREKKQTRASVLPGFLRKDWWGNKEKKPSEVAKPFKGIV